MGSVYVFGKVSGTDATPRGRVALSVLTPTKKGWRCRSTLADRMNHDYVSGESYDDVMAVWIDRELSRMYVSTDRDEVLDLLATSDDRETPSRPESLRVHSFLHGDPGLSRGERAERVLRHLELGW